MSFEEIDFIKKMLCRKKDPIPKSRRRKAKKTLIITDLESSSEPQSAHSSCPDKDTMSIKTSSLC